MAEKNTKAISASKRKELKKSLVWGGVMSKPNTQQEINARAFSVQVSKVFGIPPMGVNAMGTQPYINKDGRLFLLNDIRKGSKALKDIKTEFLAMALKPGETAICKKTLIFRDGLIVEGIGEANEANIKLAAVKLTPNLMAETRALNRAIWQAIAGDVWNRVEKNLLAMNIKPEDQKLIAAAGSVSYEEMQGQPIENGPVDDQSAATAEEMFQKAYRMIGQIKTTKSLMGAAAGIKTSEVYNNDQKTALLKLIKERTKIIAK